MHHLVTLLFLLRFIISQASTHAPPSSSPKASTDLICHTAHASECYPKIFQPTKQFKTVHDDQELPPGLHIRLNLQTGVKEARLNVPEGGEDDQSAVAVVLEPDGEPSPLRDDQSSSLRDGQQQQPLIPVIKDDEDREPPRILIPDTANVEDRQVFDRSLAILTGSTLTDISVKLAALADLEELCHSIEWGLTLARDTAIVVQLQDNIIDTDADDRLRSASALLLSTSFRNNPSVLETASNGTDFSATLIPSLVKIIHTSKDVSLLTRTISLQASISQNDAYLFHFVRNQGLRNLRDLFDTPQVHDDKDEKIRRKIADFIYDYLPQLQSLARREGTNEKEDVTIAQQAMDADIDTQEQIENCLKDFEEIFNTYLQDRNRNGIAPSDDPAYESVKAAYEALRAQERG